MKGLKHAHKDFEGNLKEGDWVIVELEKTEVVEDDLRTISINLMQIETLEKHNIVFKPVGASYYLPLYRIRQVVNTETSLLYHYKGYDYLHIMMDAGEINKKTYDGAIKAAWRKE